MQWDLKAVLGRYRKTVKGLAEHLGKSRPTTSIMVNAKKMPRISQDELEAIAEYIGCEVGEFLIVPVPRKKEHLMKVTRASKAA